MMKLDKSLVGKTLKVYIPKRYYPGSKITQDSTYIVGECKFVGFNPLYGANQITINRMPIVPVSPNQIEIL